MATNNARDNLKKQEYFRPLRFAGGLRHLAEEYPFPAGQAGQINPYNKPQRRNAVNHLKVILNCLLIVSSSHGRPGTRFRAHGAVSLAGYRFDPRQAEIHNAHRTAHDREELWRPPPGDKDFWIVDVVGNFCFVHPAKQGISSNLNLITDKGNIYSFTPGHIGLDAGYQS